jgi:hypothetical protein
MNEEFNRRVAVIVYGSTIFGALFGGVLGFFLAQAIYQ